MQTLLENIHTLNDKEKLSEEVDILLTALYQNKGEGFNMALDSRVRAWVSEIIKSQISEGNINPEEYLDNLKKELEGFRLLRLAIAFEPTNKTVERFSYFVKKNIGEKVILDLAYDPSILGGCVIIYEGNYRDYSLKRIFEAEFETIRESVKTMLEKTSKQLIQKDSTAHGTQNIQNSKPTPQVLTAQA